MEAKAVCMAGKHSPEFYSPCPFQKFLKFLLSGDAGKREVDGERKPEVEERRGDKAPPVTIRTLVLVPWLQRSRCTPDFLINLLSVSSAPRRFLS